MKSRRTQLPITRPGGAHAAAALAHRPEEAVSRVQYAGDEQ